MSDQTTPPADQGGTPPPAEQGGGASTPPPPASSSSSSGTTRRGTVETATDGPKYAAYDKRYERFVGGVHDSKKAATDAAKDRGLKASDVDVRDVSVATTETRV